MSRLNKQCPGDCSKCELLANSEVSMIPCILDQMFQRIQKMELNDLSMKESMSVLSSNIDQIKDNLDNNAKVYLASSPNDDSSDTNVINEEE